MNKIFKSLIPIFLIVLLAGCSSAKVDKQELYGVEWELEYLSGPKIAFNGLFPDKKPYIKFDDATKTVSGSNGCNGYSAPYTLDGTSLSFGEPGPTTMMYCGEGEQFFMKTIKKVNAFQLDSDGKLNLMFNEIPMMRFKKKEN